MPFGFRIERPDSYCQNRVPINNILYYRTKQDLNDFLEIGCGSCLSKSLVSILTIPNGPWVDTSVIPATQGSKEVNRRVKQYIYHHSEIFLHSGALGISMVLGKLRLQKPYIIYWSKWLTILLYQNGKSTVSLRVSTRCTNQPSGLG